jgi:hypothetical protein
LHGKGHEGEAVAKILLNELFRKATSAIVCETIACRKTHRCAQYRGRAALQRPALSEAEWAA